ncbi:MAG: ABC transporter permease [Actinomycetota bacterium]|nr:ABC transporter permease [Actinomycetota bacterium]
MSTGALAWRQFRLERRMFWRNPTAAFFNFLLPLLFLFMIATAFGSDGDDMEILVPGIAGMAVMTTTFTALAFNVTFLREQGVLKRVMGSPMPPLSYFGGLIASAVLNAVAQVVLVVAIGHLVYDLSWPREWLELLLFTVAGVAAFASLGIAFSHAIPNYDAAAAYVNAVFLPLIFISGTFYSTEHLPDVLHAIASALPLKPAIDGLRDAIVAGDGLADNLGSLAALAAWAVAGTTAAVRWFRWE